MASEHAGGTGRLVTGASSHHRSRDRGCLRYRPDLVPCLAGPPNKPPPPAAAAEPWRPGSRMQCPADGHRGLVMGGERKVLWVVLIVAGGLLGLVVLGMVLAYIGLWEGLFR